LTSIWKVWLRRSAVCVVFGSPAKIGTEVREFVEMVVENFCLEWDPVCAFQFSREGVIGGNLWCKIPEKIKKMGLESSLPPEKMKKGVVMKNCKILGENIFDFVGRLAILDTCALRPQV
jgi:hypothetical protein